MAYANILGIFGHEWITKAHAGNWIRRVLGLLELAETQEFDFIPELEESN